MEGFLAPWSFAGANLGVQHPPCSARCTLKPGGKYQLKARFQGSRRKFLPRWGSFAQIFFAFSDCLEVWKTRLWSCLHLYYGKWGQGFCSSNCHFLSFSFFCLFWGHHDGHNKPSGEKPRRWIYDHKKRRSMTNFYNLHVDHIDHHAWFLTGYKWPISFYGWPSRSHFTRKILAETSFICPRRRVELVKGFGAFFHGFNRWWTRESICG